MVDQTSLGIEVPRLDDSPARAVALWRRELQRRLGVLGEVVRTTRCGEPIPASLRGEVADRLPDAPQGWPPMILRREGRRDVYVRPVTATEKNMARPGHGWRMEWAPFALCLALDEAARDRWVRDGGPVGTWPMVLLAFGDGTAAWLGGLREGQDWREVQSGHSPHVEILRVHRTLEEVLA